ncbi:hypothetical protein FJTKL_02034 [Diaporthe vaccinii]|uniref:Sugar transporter n=1 Tax=Diaporthe vaccinii TaxID=105482 RepID=A0ABR4DZE8_9PEZI
MTEKSTVSLVDRFRAQVEQRNLNDRALIEGPLVHLSDKELQTDVKEFSRHLPDVEYDDVLRAARVAKDIRTYDQVARNFATQTNLLVALEDDEKEGLVSEHDELRGQFRQIFPVILTVGCAAFLQGHVQASINCASLYARWFECLSPDCRDPPEDWLWEWKLGAANSSPFFAAAIIGAPSSLLLNFWVGRRGAITVAALMILASSLGSAYVNSWWQLLCVRIVNGVGMGIKALQALRDLYLIHKSVELDEYRATASEVENAGMSHAKSGLTYANQFWTAVVYCSRQYALLFKETKLRNAVLSTCVVALAQQLCGINVFAFYSNTFFVGTSGNRLSAMGFSTGFVNLFFAGVLTLVYPELDPALHRWGGLALFSALNLVAFVLVFLLVEETKGFSLEDLSMVFAVPKRKFVAFQLRYVGYLYRKYLRRSKDEEEPEFYTVALDHRRNNQPDASIRGGDESDMSEE